MSNGGNLIFIFDGTFDGFLNTIYIYYYEKLMPKDIVTEQFQQEIGVEYVMVETDYEKSKRVFDGIKSKMSALSAETLYAAFSFKGVKYMNLFNYTLLGFKNPLLDSALHIDYVLETQNYAKAVLNEAHLLKGFCRFSETNQNVYYCKITPKHDVLVFLVDHFTDRLKEQRWIIHDTIRQTAAIYDTNEVMITDAGPIANVVYSDSELDYQKMWDTFFNSIAIEGRKNTKLQKHFVRRHHRKNMPEFNSRG